MPTRKLVPILLLVSGVCTGVHAQTVTRTNTLRLAAAEQEKKDRDLAVQLQRVASEKKWPLAFKNKFGETVRLTGIDAQGYPLYTSTESNLTAANTIGTSRLWSGGGWACRCPALQLPQRVSWGFGTADVPGLPVMELTGRGQQQEQ